MDNRDMVGSSMFWEASFQEAAYLHSSSTSKYYIQ